MDRDLAAAQVEHLRRLAHFVLDVAIASNGAAAIAAPGGDAGANGGGARARASAVNAGTGLAHYLSWRAATVAAESGVESLPASAVTRVCQFCGKLLSPRTGDAARVASRSRSAQRGRGRGRRSMVKVALVQSCAGCGRGTCLERVLRKPGPKGGAKKNKNKTKNQTQSAQATTLQQQAQSTRGAAGGGGAAGRGKPQQRPQKQQQRRKKPMPPAPNFISLGREGPSKRARFQHGASPSSSKAGVAGGGTRPSLTSLPAQHPKRTKRKGKGKQQPSTAPPPSAAAASLHGFLASLHDTTT